MLLWWNHAFTVSFRLHWWVVNWKCQQECIPAARWGPPFTHVLNSVSFPPCLLQTQQKVCECPSNIHCDGDPEANIAVFCFWSPGEHRSPAGLLKCSQQLQSAAWGKILLDLSLGSVPSRTRWTSVALALPPPSPSTCFWGSRHHGRLGMAGLLPSFPSWLLVLPHFLCMWCLEEISIAWTAAFPLGEVSSPQHGQPHSCLFYRKVAQSTNLQWPNLWGLLPWQSGGMRHKPKPEEPPHRERCSRCSVES